MMEVKILDKICNKDLLKRIESKTGNIFADTKRDILLKTLYWEVTTFLCHKRMSNRVKNPKVSPNVNLLGAY